MTITDFVSHPRVSPGFRWLSGVRAFFSAFLRMAFNPYQPEAHYMRGPGPACAAKESARAGSH